MNDDSDPDMVALREELERHFVSGTSLEVIELNITSAVIYLSLGYEANAFETMHYEFTPESEPRLTPGIATHYSLYLGRPPRRA